MEHNIFSQKQKDKIVEPRNKRGIITPSHISGDHNTAVASQRENMATMSYAIIVDVTHASEISSDIYLDAGSKIKSTLSGGVGQFYY